MGGRNLAATLCSVLLGGCAGAQYLLPDITAAEIDRAALTVAGDTSSLPTFHRTGAEYGRLVDTVSNRLRLGVPALCRHAGFATCFFDVSYVADDTVNAYAAGSNEIVIYRGILRYLETEDEVAAVIAHEIGHHLARHVEEQQRNAALGGLVAAILTGGLMAGTGYQAPPNDPYAGQQVVRDAAQLGAGIGAISFSKEQEREADLLAAYLLARSGYDLRRAGHAFTVLAKMSGKTRSTIFDTHPAGPERIAAWEKAVAEVEASRDLLPKAE